MNQEQYVRVEAIKDESGHWYVIPIELVKDFYEEQEDENFVDSGEFDWKYRKYRTGGDLNLIELYVKLA